MSEKGDTSSAHPQGIWLADDSARRLYVIRQVGHTAKLIFMPSEAKWLNGELAHIEVEK